jgi:hypothetical protein
VPAELIINEVAGVIVSIDRSPIGLAPVAPILKRVSIIIELAVTAVVATVAVPLTKVTVPKLLAPAVVVEATLVEIILLPAVPRTRLPLVAVIAPRVAVMVVPEVSEVVVVSDPGAVIATGRLNVVVPAVSALLIWLAVPART